MILDHPARYYRRAGLGHLVRAPVRAPWIPPAPAFGGGPQLIRPDIATLRRVIEGLRRL